MAERLADVSENNDMIDHTIDASAQEHKCQMCEQCATHKISEAIDSTADRHPFTAFVCCKHFGKIFGPVAKMWCFYG